MASHREQVVQAVLALVRAALPNAEVERDAPWPQRASPGGLVIIRDGDPGPAEECFSPRSFTYRHEIELEVFGPEGTQDRHEVLDAMLIDLGVGVLADPSLGGLCNWFEVAGAPSPDDVNTQNGQPVRAATVSLMAEYTTSSPLS
ncbi:MAG: hypothetical protein ACK4M2_01700 [Brevundimonas sp.]